MQAEYLRLLSLAVCTDSASLDSSLIRPWSRRSILHIQAGDSTCTLAFIIVPAAGINYLRDGGCYLYLHISMGLGVRMYGRTIYLCTLFTCLCHHRRYSYRDQLCNYDVVPRRWPK